MLIFVCLCLSQCLKRQCWMCCKGKFQTFRSFLMGFVDGVTASQSNTREKGVLNAVKMYVLASNILPEAQNTSLVYKLVARRFARSFLIWWGSKGYSAHASRDANRWSEILRSMISLYAVKPRMCLIIDGYQCSEYHWYFHGLVNREHLKKIRIVPWYWNPIVNHFVRFPVS